MSNKKASGFLAITKRTAKSVALSTVEMANIAMLNMKLKTQHARLGEKYEQLGRLYRNQLEGSTRDKGDLARLTREIDALQTVIADTRSEMQARKEALSKRKR